MSSIKGHARPRAYVPAEVNHTDQRNNKMDDIRELALSQRLWFPASQVAKLTGYANFGAGEDFLLVFNNLLY